MFSKIWFSKFKKFVATSVFGELQLTQMSLNFNTSFCNLKIRGVGTKMCVAFLFNFERNCFQNTNSPSILLDKNLIQTRWNPKWKIPNTVFEKQTLYFSSYENHKLKVKLRWVGACESKNTAFFLPFILSKGDFLTFVFYLNV